METTLFFTTLQNTKIRNYRVQTNFSDITTKLLFLILAINTILYQNQ